MTNQRRHRLRARLPIALATATAAIATTAALASAGSAQTSTKTLHLLGQAQRGVGFSPKGKPRPGDRVGFGDKITGDDTGSSRGVCTLIGRTSASFNALLCTIQVQLSNGTLSAEGLLPQQAHNTPVAIIGGTGAYNGARGTALVTNVTATKTDINITLLP